MRRQYSSLKTKEEEMTKYKGPKQNMKDDKCQWQWMDETRVYEEESTATWGNESTSDNDDEENWSDYLG